MNILPINNVDFKNKKKYVKPIFKIEKNHIKQINYDLINFINIGCEFDTPINIIDALKTIYLNNESLTGISTIKKDIAQMITNLRNQDLSKLPLVTELLNAGSSAMVFKTVNDDVLKLTNCNHFPMNRKIEDFDVPIFQKYKFGNTRIYHEEKLSQEGLCPGHIEYIKQKILSKGYKTYDIGESYTDQIGFSKNGELYLLDPECAQYKTIFHCIFSKTKDFFKNLFNK